MRKKVWIVIALNLLTFGLAFGIYAAGYEYDLAHRLYPEAYYFSYDAAITVYGKRWERISTTLVFLSLLADAVLVVIWYRKHQNTLG